MLRITADTLKDKFAACIDFFGPQLDTLLKSLGDSVRYTELNEEVEKLVLDRVRSLLEDLTFSAPEPIVPKDLRPSPFTVRQITKTLTKQ